MPSTIICPNPDCTASYSVADHNLGQMGQCEKCGTNFPLVPGTRVEAPSSTSDFDFDSMHFESFNDPLPTSISRYKVIRDWSGWHRGPFTSPAIPNLTVKWLLRFRIRSGPWILPRGSDFCANTRAVAQFQHENFCPIFDIDESDTTPFLVMAYIKGKSLDGLIETGVPWDLRRAAETVRRLAVALAEAHQRGLFIAT